MTKVLKIVPSYFKNESRDLREVSTLADKGYKVKVYAWYQDGLEKSENGDFAVERFPVGNGKSIIDKVMSYLRFGFQCIKNANEFKPDIISAHDLPVLIIAMIIKRKSSCRVLYDSHELTSEMASNRHQPKFVVSLKRLMERLLIHKVDAVMVVSDSIARYNYEKYNLDKIPYVIRSTPERGTISTKSMCFRNKYNLNEDQTILLYQGAIRPGRGIEKLLEVMTALDEKMVLILMGYGDLVWVNDQVAARHLENRVFLHDAVPYHDLIEYSSGADIGISLIENYCLSYYYSLPNKLFEYIQSGIPVICSNFPDMTAIINEYKVGETADPEDINDIKNKIILASEKLKNGEYEVSLSIAKAELCWEKEQLKLLQLYENIVKGR